jgi:hypothetical protein
MKKKNKDGTISAEEFDRRFEKGEDIASYLDFEKAVVVKKINVDFPLWMVKRLDREATRLNVSRQAVIKMWINDRLHPQRLAA